MIGKVLALIIAYVPAVLQIRLVSHQEANHVGLRILLCFSHSILHIVKALSVGDVIYNDDSVGSMVIIGGNSFEPFLPGSVPNLQPDVFIVDVDGFHFEVDADSVEEVGGKNVVHVPHEHAALAHSAISNEHQLQLEIVLQIFSLVPFGTHPIIFIICI